ncbi:hypothetical protein [Ulvibacter antarcticus]|nr:hypothetical protein [Ulvibacter antarcticus]
MKKIYTFIAVSLVLSITVSKAQEVGIGTTDPKSTLDIQIANPSSPSNTDGLLIPRISNFPTTNPGNQQDGMIVFLTSATGTYKKGFHYWDNTPKKWIAYNEEWNDGNVAQVHSGFTPNLIYARQADATGTDVVVLDSGHIGMGTSAPEESLELKLVGDNDIQITSASAPDAPQLTFYTMNDTFESPDFMNDDDPIGYITGKVWAGSGKSGDVANIQLKADGNHSSGNLPTKIEFAVTEPGDSGITEHEPEMVIRSTGNVGIGITNPTAVLNLKAGTSSANSAPLKLTAGTNLSTAEQGAIEFDGTNLYFTPNTTRKVFLNGVSNSQSLNFPNIGSRGTSELTMSVTGAITTSSCSCAPAPGIENNLQWSCYVSSAGVVTIRLTNVSSGSVNPSDRNWKVTVID